jgi:CheY-like chemotaxis protein
VISVLLVDDDALNRELMREMLTHWGFVMFEAENGAEALRMLESAAPSVVITDIRMPVLDGLALLRAIRADQRWKTLPVIALTGNSDDSLAQHGFDVCLPKALAVAHIRDTILQLTRE